MSSRTRQSDATTLLTTTRTPTTNDSLLSDISRNPNSERIDEFARIYEPVMRRYAMQAQRRLHGALCESDQDDLVQEAFVAVRRALPQFRYDRSKGRFRNYLSLTIRNLALRFRRKSAAMRPSDPQAMASVADTGAANGGHGADEAEQGMMLSIWSIAYALVVAKRNFSPNTLAIFKSHVLDGNPVTQVAEEFKTSTMAVYQIKDRIVRAVRAEIESARPAGGGLVELQEALIGRAEAAGGSARA